MSDLKRSSAHRHSVGPDGDNEERRERGGEGARTARPTAAPEQRGRRRGGETHGEAAAV